MHCPIFVHCNYKNADENSSQNEPGCFGYLVYWEDYNEKNYKFGQTYQLVFLKLENL